MSAPVAIAQQAPEVAKQASGSSFYTAMRMLPRAQREAMFDIYSFCRQVDDIADSDRPHPERLEALKRWRAHLAALYAGSPPAHLRRLAATVRAFHLGEDDFLALIEGMEMDATADIRAPDLATLDHYCDCVASAAGRLSVRIFGISTDEGIRLAHHLGRALQFTNILRDIDEDATMGRLYLPRELLHGAGLAGAGLQDVLASPALGQVCLPLIVRARAHFEDARRIMDRLPRRSVRAPRIMAGIYSLILERLARRGWMAPRHQIHIPRWRALAVVLRYAFW
jgi:phytoene synthase